MRGRRLGRTVGMIVLGSLLGVALAETWVRIAPWTPRSQIVRGTCLRSVDGVPVWGCEDTPDDIVRHNRACVEQHPERTRILFFGSSITYGAGLTAQETFTTGLEARLNQLQPNPGFCVLNFAQLGFQFEQKYAVARTEVPRYRPALIMWESWVEWREFRIIGDAAYGISDYRLRPDGFIAIAGVPDWLNRFLFRRSRLYEYLALRYGQPAISAFNERDSKAFADSRFIKVVELARSSGAKLAWYFAPPLDRPFAESAAAQSPTNAVWSEFAQAHGIPTYFLAKQLIDQDYESLRLDPCCHYNAAGHRALVSVMAQIVLEQLGDQPPVHG
jgi:hypothetical protein